MKLTFASLFAERLNLNGDQANLAVLATRAREYGHEVDIVSIEAPSNQQFDLFFVGHGSVAAWKSIESLGKDLLSYAVSSTATLAVGNGAERVAAELQLKLTVGTRSSRFAEHVLVDGSHTETIIGYENTLIGNLGTLWVDRHLLSTLHGPVLAKNPAMADRLLKTILKARGEELGSKTPRLAELDQLSSRAAKDALR